MLIMNSRETIFVHSQKCGGTSVELAYWEACKWNDVLIGSSLIGEIVQWEYFGKFGLHKHSNAREIMEVVGEEIWSKYFKWATVRNPFSRVTSLYNYLAALVETYAAQMNFPLDAPVDEQRAWLGTNEYPAGEPWSYPGVKAYLETLGGPSTFGAFLRHPLLTDDSAFQPQWWGLQTHSGETLAIDEFVKVEDLNTEWPRLCKRMAMPALQLDHANDSRPRRKWAPTELFVDPDDVELMRERFSPDFWAFGYDPGLLPDR